jgi:hypothetical protein
VSDDLMVENAQNLIEIHYLSRYGGVALFKIAISSTGEGI